MSAAPSLPPTVKELIRNSLQASKEHQYALKVYTERLEAELEAVDRLLTAAEAPDDDQDVDVGGHVVIPGALKAISPIPSEIAPGEHPFVDDVAKRQKYMQHTTIHPMKAADFEALADAVRSENHRLHALAAQKRGQQPFVGLNDHPQSHFEKNKQDINWERVAQKVTAATSNPVKRTAEECEIRWLGERHPDFDRSQWPPSEIVKVKQLVGSAKECEIDWADIATKLGTRRTPLDCMRHAIPRKMHVWTQESDQRLIEMVKVYGTENWQLTRQISEDATATQCQNRYTRSLDPQLRRGPWAQEEDEQLRRAVEIFGRSWVDVSVFIPARSNEQCRDRWQDVLNPSISKGKWSESEDQILRSACEELGEKWKEISQRVGGGRTDNMCRHRYSLLQKRKLKRSVTGTTSRETSTPTSEAVTGPHHPSPAPTPIRETPCSETSATPAPQKAKPKPRPRIRRAGTQPDGEGIPSTSSPDMPSPPTVESGPNVTVASAHVAAETDTAGGGTSTTGTHAGGASSSQTASSTIDGVIQEEGAPQRRGRGRPRKRPQPDGDSVGGSAAKKPRTGKGKESDTCPVNSPQAQEAQHETNVALNTSHISTDAAPTMTTGLKRGQKKPAEPAPRPTPVRQSARLRNARGT